MTENNVKACIARAIEIKQIIANLEDEQKKLKAKLLAHAETRTQEHIPTDGGGWSWEATDHDDNLVRVTTPAPRLKNTLNPEAKGFDKIKAAAGRAWSLLFFQKPAYGLVDDFKNQVHLHLGGRDALKLIKLVSSDSTPTVSFEVAKGDA